MEDIKNTQALEPELLPCPLCGCHGPKLKSDAADPRRHTIKCEDCPCRAEFFSSDREQAIAAWNKRASPPAAPVDAQPVAWEYQVMTEHNEWRVTKNKAWAESLGGPVIPLYRLKDAQKESGHG